MARSFLLCTVLSFCALLVSVSAVCNSPQVTCPSSSDQQAPLPFYSLTFDNDPSTAVGGTIDYKWIGTDISETCPYLHSGVVYTGITSGNGGASDGSGLGYIDLNATTGPNSAGSALTALPNLGSPSSGVVSAGTSGWSFEFTGKAFSQTAWAKFYCMGDGPGVYDILQGFVSGTNEVDHTLDYATGTFNRVVLPPNSATTGLQLNACPHIDTISITQIHTQRHSLHCDKV